MPNLHTYVRARQLGDCDPLQFPSEDRTTEATHTDPTPEEFTVEATLAAVENLSWKLEDLAREFNCFGYFDDDDDDDRPRAA